VENARPPLDGGHEGQASQHGELPRAGLELAAPTSSLVRKRTRGLGQPRGQGWTVTAVRSNDTFDDDDDGDDGGGDT
jgi:hypothetical protein